MSAPVARGRAGAPMKPRMALGDFLVAYLKRAGVTHLFGLPGDLVLGLFHRFGRARGLEIVTFSHEPAVGFAADGYARSTRRLGVLCVTYGAGGHNVVNPVAGAYAEQVPLLVVSGGPGEAEAKLAGVHHQAKDVESRAGPRDPRREPPRLPRDPPRPGRRGDPGAEGDSGLERALRAAHLGPAQAR